MAKKSMIARETKRTKLNNRFDARREELKAVVSNEDADYDSKWDAMMALQKLPRDSSKARQRNRCGLTGRPHGYYRKFGLSRNKLREIILKGQAPGVVKASW
ncbi:30S ribosomal protein S14 [Arenicella xantha]|uniref:Small ribosomal subunit protein uS14 n=1 Tax=Arenicella xantha TaxID=644221 RepID=A0A395JKV6_9GAMM|nr:30S ribosomal protein S14 [Arenicella xantha]RBP49821.1 SSU ribosomal protein S14P [Arenicella xantha]